MNKTSKKVSCTDFLLKVICNTGMRNYNQSNIDTFLHTVASHNRTFVINFIPFSTIYQTICLSFCPQVLFPLSFLLQSSSKVPRAEKLRNFQGCYAIMGYSRKNQT